MGLALEGAQHIGLAALFGNDAAFAWLGRTPVWRMRLRFVACRLRLLACPFCGHRHGNRARRAF